MTENLVLHDDAIVKFVNCLCNDPEVQDMTYEEKLFDLLKELRWNYDNGYWIEVEDLVKEFGNVINDLIEKYEVI